MKTMKKIMIILMLGLFMPIVATKAQSPFEGFFKPLEDKTVTLDQSAKDLLAGEWKFRTDVGLTCPAFGFSVDEATGKINGIEGKDFAKMFAGIVFTHVQADATRDWGAGMGVTIPIDDYSRYGLAILGGYSVFRVGVNYDFGLPFKEGISLLGGITVDLFTLTE